MVQVSINKLTINQPVPNIPISVKHSQKQNDRRTPIQTKDMVIPISFIVFNL